MLAAHRSAVTVAWVSSLSNRVLAAYASPGIPLAALGLPLVVFLPPYYAGELGLDLAAVGFVFFLVRMVDMPFDTVLGHWMDATRTRWGRFKPWMVAGGLILLVSTAMVFFAQRGVGILYLFFWVLLLYAGYSMLYVGHMAWGATLSPDYHQRSRIYSWWIGGHLFGLIAVLLLPVLVGLVMQGGSPATIKVMGGFILAAIPFSIIAALVVAPEGRAAVPHVRIRLADVRRLVTNRVLLLMLVADILVNLAPGATGALFRFVLEQLAGFSSREAAVMLLLYFVAGLVSLPIWLKLAIRVGKPRAAAVAALLGAALHVGAYLLFSLQNQAISTIAMACAGIPYAAPGFLLRAMMADFGDEERLEGGADRIGLLNAVLSTAQKLGYALPVGILFPILALVGFNAEPGMVNSPRALRWVEVFWISLPIGLLVPAAWALARIPLSPERLATVQAALARTNGAR